MKKRRSYHQRRGAPLRVPQEMKQAIESIEEKGIKSADLKLLAEKVLSY
jgi:hypothetical protein